MNAISEVFDPMGKPPAVTRVAEYFRGLAESGKGCATNNGTIARALGLSIVSVSRAKTQLVNSGRLVSSWQTWVSIDGQKFGAGTLDEDVEMVKTVLRKKYRCVVDRRTVADPGTVASGVPTELVVDGRSVPWAEATAMAKRITESGR